MNTKTKFFAALTALTLAATFALPSNAEARGRGWAIGAGLVGAAIVGRSGHSDLAGLRFTWVAIAAAAGSPNTIAGATSSGTPRCAVTTTEHP